jgi:hypothetical protein
MLLLLALLAGNAQDLPVLAIEHASVVTMERAGVLRDHTVLVRAGRIAALGPAAEPCCAPW